MQQEPHRAPGAPALTAPRLTILHVVAPAEVGGLESVVRLLSTGQRAHGHRVLVAAVTAPATRAHPFLDALVAAGVETVPIAIPARAYHRERALMRQLIARSTSDVVHTHGYRPDLIDAPVARSLGVPTVTTVHGFTGGGAKNRMYEWLQRRAFRHFDAVVAVSGALASDLARCGVPAGRIHHLPNAYARTALPLEREVARHRLGLPAHGFVLGWVGRLSEEKGPDVLVRALRHAPADVHAAIIGEGPMREALERQGEAQGLGTRIHWHGTVRDAATHYRAFDAFVLSSRTEGIPIVLFEAMDAGVPIIATHVGGVPEVVGDREALLVGADDPQALGAAITATQHDPAAARARALAAGERLVDRFGIAPWLSAYEDLYLTIQRMPRSRTT